MVEECNIKIESEILIFKIFILIGLVLGVLISIASIILVYYKIITIDFGQWLVPLGIAIFSIGLACLSIFRSLETEKRMRDLEKKEIKRKLSIFQVENNSNIELIQKLYDHKNNWFPKKLLEKKLKQQKPQKYMLTPSERKQINGLWIPKEEFSYQYALQVIELSHFFEDDFIHKIEEYIKKGKKLNNHKYICQHWALSRGVPNPDETKNYYTALDNVNDVTDKMKYLIKNQIKKIEL